MDLQEEYVRRANTIRGVIDDIRAKEAWVDSVLGSLIAQAFNGTLTAKWREANPGASTQPVIENALTTAPDEGRSGDPLDADLEGDFGNRALFWKDVPTESRLNAVYNAFSPDAYYNAQTVADTLNQPGQDTLTEYEVTAALDILTAAGLMLPVALEMPDPANPTGAVVCINAYRLLNEGDNGQKDFQTTIYTFTDTLGISEAFSSETK
jgi:hypothetical protein